jgi:BRO family, N-terminal domain/P63C domain
MEMNDQALKKFEFHGASLRSVMIKGEPWFVADDVTEILGLGNPRAAVARHVEDRNTVTIRDGIAGNPNHTIVNESGLYSLIFGSTKPEAKRFKHWVTKEVLPEIRRTGRYSKDVSPWLSSDPSQWCKTFPDAYFLHIFRLKGKRPPKDGNLKYTPWLAHINNDLIYKRLDVGVSEALNRTVVRCRRYLRDLGNRQCAGCCAIIAAKGCSYYRHPYGGRHSKSQNRQRGESVPAYLPLAER